MSRRPVHAFICAIVIAALVEIHPAHADFAAGAQAYNDGD